MTYQLNEKVVFEEVDGEIVILNLTSGIYYQLNRSATVVWKGTLANEPARVIEEKLNQAFEIQECDVQGDMRRSVEDWIAKGLISQVEDG